MLTGDIEFRVHHFDHLASSNIHAQEMIKQGELQHADVIWTDYQEIGKGQQSAHWESKPNENLLLSVYLELNWPADQLFQFNKIASLAVYDLLDNLAVPQIAIKWPNDILVNSTKICGILVENSIRGNRAKHTVIGIGLNVNQIDFAVYDRKATSLAIELKRQLNRVDLLKRLLSKLNLRLSQLIHKPSILDEDYESKLYGLGQLMTFESEGEKFKASVIGLDQDGRLVLKRGDKRLQFDLKELHFLD